MKDLKGNYVSELSMKPDVLCITDLNGSGVQERILEEILRKVGEPEIGWRNVSIKRLTDEEQKIIAESSRSRATHESFVEKYERIKSSLDKEQLLIYSRKANPRLHERLDKGNDVGNALWLAYREQIEQGGWESDFNYRGVIVDEAAKMGYPNVLEILFNHVVIATEFGKPGNIPYHMIGRGFVAEGCRWPLQDKEAKPTGNNAILLPISLVTHLEEGTQKAYAHELINHEIFGHTILKLKDHSVTEVDPKDCIMSIPEGREEFIDLAKQKRGLVFCSSCEQTYKQSNIYKK